MMMKRTSLLWMLLFPVMVGAQMDYIYYFDQVQPVSYTCDGTTFFDANGNWTVYQAEGDTVNGAPDPAFCGYVYPQGWNFEIHLLQYEEDRPVFMKWEGEDIPVASNKALTMDMYLVDPGALDFFDIENCQEGLCQGWIMATQVPDDPNDEDDVPEKRWHYLELLQSWWSGSYSVSCFASEYFEGQLITDLVFKLNPAEGQNVIPIGNFYLAQSYMQQLFNQEFIDVNEWSNQIYVNGWEGPHIATHDTETFPGPANVTYLEWAPLNNPNEEQTVYIIVQQASLLFQPFTEIRGAPVEGNESERHNVVLQFLDAGLCIDDKFWELVLGPGDGMIVDNGSVHMNRSSCVRVSKDAFLQIADGSTFEYGVSGEGMLALHPGCSVELQGQSTVLFNSVFSLWENPWEAEPDDVHIWLRPGQQWIFGPHSAVSNRSQQDRMQAVFHLAGGYLDLGTLSEEDRKHIRVEYVSESSEFSILRIAENPLADGWLMEYNSPQAGWTEIRFFDAAGRMVFTEKIQSAEGYNQVHLQRPAVAAGIYTVVLQSGKSSASVNLYVR